MPQRACALLAVLGAASRAVVDRLLDGTSTGEGGDIRLELRERDCIIFRSGENEHIAGNLAEADSQTMAFKR